MDIFIDPTYWLIAACILIGAEFLLPGGVVIFLGGGCLVVALSLWLGLVTSWTTAFTLFFISSLLLILTLRAFFMKFAEGDSSIANTFELVDVVGKQATVIETIGPGDSPGRILFRDTEWPALGDGSEITAGSSATIVSQVNLSYIVERSTEQQS